MDSQHVDERIRQHVADQKGQPVVGYTFTDNRRYTPPAEFGSLSVPDAQAALVAADAPVERFDPQASEYRPVVKDAVEVAFDLSPLKMYWGEYLQRHSVAADMNGWLKEFKALLPNVNGIKDATVLTMGGAEVATYRRSAKLNTKQLEAEQPQVVEKYTRPVTEMKFDEDAFRRDMPAMHAAYRGRQLKLVRRAGITLAHITG